MNVFTVDLKNQPGELAHVCEALGARGVNIELAGIGTGDHGQLFLTANDEDAARRALDSARVPYTELQSLQVRCKDQPGAVAAFTSKLAQAHVNVTCLLPTSICGGEAVFALCVDRIDDARQALGNQIIG